MAAYNYSGTKCPKCEHTSFEYAEDTPTNAPYAKHYLRCSKCKTFLAMTFINNTNILVEKVQKDIDEIKRKVGIF